MNSVISRAALARPAAKNYIGTTPSTSTADVTGTSQYSPKGLSEYSCQPYNFHNPLILQNLACNIKQMFIFDPFFKQQITALSALSTSIFVYFS